MQSLNRRSVWIVTLAAGILAGLLVVILRSAWEKTPVSLGGIAPDIQAQTVTGQSFSLNALRGQPVVLNFFTPWCQPCIQETPDLIAFDHKYGDRVHVVLIDRGDSPVLVKRYVAQYALPTNLTVLLNPADKWSASFGVTGQPETFFLTAAGKVVKHELGPLSESQLVAAARAAGLS